MDHTIDHTFESANRVYDVMGICPTIPTGVGGGHIPKILEKINWMKEIKNKKDYLNLILDDFYICKERLKVYKDVCPTILSERYGLKVVVVYEWR